MLIPEVRHIFRKEMPTNLVHRWSTKTRIADKFKGQGHVVRLTDVGP